MNTHYLSPDALGQRFGCHPRTIVRHARRFGIGFRMGGVGYRFTEADAAALEAALRRETRHAEQESSQPEMKKTKRGVRVA